MKSLIKKSFWVLKDNLIFIQPILIYLVLLMISMQYLSSGNMGLYPKILMGLSVFLFAVSSMTGVFYISKKALADYNSEDSLTETAQKSIKNFKTFFTGIGKYFFKILSGTILFLCLWTVFVYTIGTYLNHTIGIAPLQTLFEAFNKSENLNEINSFANSLSRHDLYIINIWSLFFILSSIIFKFLGILYTSILISKKDNIIVSLLKMFVFFVKNIFPSILIMTFMMILYLIINIIVMAMGLNGFSFGIFFILIAMYLNYYIILVLCLYNERTKTDSNNGTECIG